jgi:hypothetical protein
MTRRLKPDPLFMLIRVKDSGERHRGVVAFDAKGPVA